MPRKSTAKATGVWEKERGSGVWWIRYRVAGKLKREKVGRRSDAIDLYRKRKSEVRAGVKLPPNMRTSDVTFAEIAGQAEEWYISHGKKDIRNVKGRMKFLVKEFGNQHASRITPAQVDFWITSHKDWSPATGNRYKALMSKTFKLALASDKVASNPARLVEQRPENNARIRFLSDGEEVKLRKAINKRCPDHMAEFDVALNTGMRKSEQYTTEWPQVSFTRKRLKLEGTKNGSDREIPLNKTCLYAFKALYKRRTHDGRVFQSKFGQDLNNSRSWFDRCIDDAGISNFTWHCLRHTFISRLVMKGVDLRTVQELAGHKTISMTARYAHLSSAHLDSAVEKLDAKAKTTRRSGSSRRVARMAEGELMNFGYKPIAIMKRVVSDDRPGHNAGVPRPK